MDNLLPLDWYFQSPIDYEYKQYILLSYLQKVDSLFIQKILSPHLLHMENMVKDMVLFDENYNQTKNDISKNKYIYFDDNSKLNGLNNDTIYEIKEIIDFSIPQIQTRVDLGMSILRKYIQILY